MKEPKMNETVNRVISELRTQGTGVLVSKDGGYSLPAELDDYSEKEIEEVIKYFDARQKYLQTSNVNFSAGELFREAKAEREAQHKVDKEVEQETEFDI